MKLLACQRHGERNEICCDRLIEIISKQPRNRAGLLETGSISTVKVTSSSPSSGIPVLGLGRSAATHGDGERLVDPTGCWNVNVMIAGDVPRVAPSDGLEPASELSLDCACGIGSAATMATATPMSAKLFVRARESAER